MKSNKEKEKKKKKGKLVIYFQAAKNVVGVRFMYAYEVSHNLINY